MSIHQKTIRYRMAPSENPADIPHDTLVSVGTGSIWIAENGPSTKVNITSAMYFWAMQDTSTLTGATLSDMRVDIGLDATASSTILNTTVDFTNTGENWAGIFGPLDATSYFNTNFGTAQSKTAYSWFDALVSTGTGTALRGIYPWIDITYEYSASAARRTDYLRIPLGTPIGAMPTASGFVFTTIPQLSGSGGLLSDYGSLIIRDSWLEIASFTGVNNVSTDININYSFDAGATGSFPIRENALATDLRILYILPNTESTIAPHSLKLWSSLASRWYNTQVWLNVVFEYDPTTTTSVINTLQFPVVLPTPLTLTGGGSPYNSFLRKFTITEPTPIVPLYSSLDLRWCSTATNAIVIWGPLLKTTTVTTPANAISGQFSVNLNIESASFSRGENEFSVFATTGATFGTTMSGLYTLIYRSAISPQGIDKHGRVIRKIIQSWDTTLKTDTQTQTYFTIPESNYYLVSVGIFFNTFTPAIGNGISIESQLEYIQGEYYPSASYVSFSTNTNMADNELTHFEMFTSAEQLIKRFPNDFNPARVDIEISRKNRYLSPIQGQRFGSYWNVCYHSITASLSGIISNSNGGWITASLHRADNGELYAQQYLNGDGNYSFTVYDDTTPVYVDFWEDNTYKGRSKTAVAGSGFNVSLSCSSGSSGGGEYSFTYIG